MKIIRPEQPIKKEITLKDVLIYQAEKEEEKLIDDNTTIENLMDEIIKQKDDKIQITISLTKRQYDLYLKKGGESWIKRVITGQKIKRVTRKA